MLLLQLPPLVASVSVVVEPTHTCVKPPIVAGKGLTVNTRVVKQPAGKVYVITAGPTVTPVTTPEAEPTDATPEALLVQRPPDTELVNVVVRPRHTLFEPPIADGEGLTVAVATTKQPPGKV